MGYSFLEPIVVAGRTFKTRIVLSAMAKHLADPKGFITDEYLAHFEDQAKSGAALITPGIMVIDPTWPYVSYNQPYLSDDKYIPGLKRFADRMRKQRAFSCCQLWHPGAAGAPAKSINTLTVGEIQRIQELYVSAARRVKEAGVDAVDFHAAHCYLPGQFLSPYFNQRTDRYGSATLDDAIRFSLEIITIINDELVDDTFFMTGKINGSDFAPNGMTPQRAAEAVKIFEKNGISMVTVNGGGVLTNVLGMSDDGRQEEGWKVHFAETVKKSASIPVAACGSIRHPKYADEIIRSGKADLIAIARGLFAEPRWGEKAASGRESEMRRCVSCMFCFTGVAKGMSGCSVNPFAKRELEIKPLNKNGEGRPVVVVGAGPAGLEAAVTLAARGFKPILLERQRDIGGQVRLAALPPGKSKLNWMLEYYRNEIIRLGVEVHLSQPATLASVQKYDPVAVILAAGSRDKQPDIPGVLPEWIRPVREVLENQEFVRGQQILILGGGLTGLETARIFRSLNNRVTILEELVFDPQKSPMELKIALDDAANEGIDLKMGHKAVLGERKRIMAREIESGKDIDFNPDIVISSLGTVPVDDLYDELRKSGLSVTKVGDCVTPGKISVAVMQGSSAALALA
ncbi:MAG: NAD(P)/FAD-dependent oxidoreductase [Deltaproteobacteria bacterium]|jgi:2,4-dienoyl-CoA reductase-like NADH-dependent reductase (Old Yellow Enzyme family)/thioredoxin reductase|nr:NAD(P)/FAD-dependent oxidoreductase [Deltaproteobacteria bacterium]